MYICYMKERIQTIIDHLVDSARVQKDEDLEICLRILNGAIDRGVVDELAQAMENFSEKKVTERMMLEN